MKQINREEIEIQVRRDFKKTMARMNGKERAIAQKHPEWIEEAIQQRIAEAMKDD